jgi:pyruvate/2-oxoglutarate dehydrogenase complex dihydrolipoamide acyltransferase (E2) component
MAYEFLLPDIGEGLTEATIVEWLVDVGADVDLDAPVVEIETDKAVVEIPAPRAGRVLHLGAPAGETIAVGEILIVIGDPEEAWSPSAAPAGAVAPDGPQERAAEAVKPIVGNLEEAGAAAADPRTPGGRAQALPLVRRLAASMGVDLASVAGSGPGGRITRKDVEDAAATSGPVERLRMSPVRRAIARNLTESWREIPHVTTFATADPEAVLAARAVGDGKLPLEAVLIARIAPLLGEFPEFNAFVDGDDLVLHRRCDVGFAVDTESGLMVAVIRDAPSLTPAEIGSEVDRLSTAARERTIKPSDVKGATFTLSNIGAVGGGFGTPIIPKGTTAILSVGRAETKPVVRNGEIVIGREMPLSLSYDHRAIDGGLGRRFLAAVVAAIEAA